MIMKAVKFFYFAVMALAFASCNTLTPPKKELIGTWTSHGQEIVRSMTFNADGTLIYRENRDTTWTGEKTATDVIGKYELRYTITDDDKLCFAGKGVYVLPETQEAMMYPFKFRTDYSLQGNKLTIDSFACDGGLLIKNFIKSLQLEKQED